MMICQTAQRYHYMLYKHPDADEEALPLIVFLHGAGERGDTQEDCPAVLKNGLPQLIETGEEPRCVIVCPQCPKDSFWAAEIPYIKAFVDEMVALYGTNPTQTVLTGISMGGFGTWLTATRYPETFCRIAPVCGGGMPWAAGALTMPIRAFHGEDDPVVDVHYSIDMVHAVKAAGNPDVTLALYPGIGHNAWEYAYDDALLAFLLHG